MGFTVVVLNLANCDDDSQWPARRVLICAQLARRGADAVLLQEVRYDAQRCGALDMASELAAALGMQCALAIAQYYDEATLAPCERVTSVWEGLAVLSRRRPASSAYLDLTKARDSTDQNHRISQRVELGAIKAYNLHLSTDAGEAGDNLWQTLGWLGETGRGWPLCGGDLNAAPSVVSPLLASHGLVDAWAAKQPDALGYTYPSSKPSERIDYLWIDARLLPQLASIELILGEPVDGLYASDHLGICAVFRDGPLT
jgi:endonuclease/exonuclease/phosphatase family metal-dependent hydrolase